VLVAEVVVEGAEGELQDEVYRVIRTRPGQITTRSQLQEDINAIFATGFFAKVEATPADTPLGVRVTFKVEPNPVLQSVNIEGNTVLPQEEIDRIFQPQYGSTLNLRELQRGTQELLKLYQGQGYVLTQVVGAPKVSPDGKVTIELAEGQVESVQVAFINKEGEEKDAEGKPIQGRTRSFIVTREMQTQPGKVFNRNTAEGDLQRIFGLGIFDDVKLDLQPAQDPRQVNVVIKVAEKRGGSIALGGGISSASGLFGTVSLQEQNLGGNDQNIGVEFQIGQRELLFDASFTDPWIAGDPYRTSYTVNGFRRRNISLVFEGPDTVNVINTDGNQTDNPRTVRTGGAINFTRPLSRNVFQPAPWTASLGLTYQRVLIQDDDNDLVSPNAILLNEQGRIVGFGSNLSWSGESKDDLLTFQFGVQNDRRNNVQRPTSGSLFRFGTEQSVPVGLGTILFNRLRTSYSFYLPTRLLKFTPECRNQPKQPTVAPKPEKPQECFQTFAFNIQAGTVLGDLPPYDAFTLGGANSIRGWDEGYVADGKSFVQGTIEYRFPLFSVLSGALFIDAGSDLGTGASVKGDPGGVRGKPGSGLGYGVGVRIQSPLGPLRIDWGFNNEGENRVNFGIGERF
jgi:outer membrane protein insertion porin family